VADVAAGYEVDYIFGDVDGVVADAFEIFGDEDELESGEDDGGILHHVGEEFAKELVAEAIDLIVALHHAAGEILIGADESVEAVANHSFGKLAHARQIHVGLHLGMAEDAHGGLRDVDGLIADAFEVTIDARNGEEEAEVGGHWLIEGKQALDAFVYFDLDLVDGVFLGEHGLGEVFFGVENGVDGLMDGALGEASHPEQALLQFIEIVFEMAFHGSSNRWLRTKARTTATAKATANSKERCRP
jgi:hypothetical protein